MIHSILGGMRNSLTPLSIKPLKGRLNSIELLSEKFKIHMAQVLRNDRGSVESAFTLIPLLLLFLAIIQVCISVYTRNVSNEVTQGSVAFAAMGAPQSQLSQGNSLWSSAPTAIPLPGGGSILVGERQVRVPGISPLLGGGDLFLSTGVAVQE